MERELASLREQVPKSRLLDSTPNKSPCHSFSDTDTRKHAPPPPHTTTPTTLSSRPCAGGHGRRRGRTRRRGPPSSPATPPSAGRRRRRRLARKGCGRVQERVQRDVYKGTCTKGRVQRDVYKGTCTRGRVQRDVYKMRGASTRQPAHAHRARRQPHRKREGGASLTDRSPRGPAAPFRVTSESPMSESRPVSLLRVIRARAATAASLGRVAAAAPFARPAGPGGRHSRWRWRRE